MTVCDKRDYVDSRLDILGVESESCNKHMPPSDTDPFGKQYLFPLPVPVINASFAANCGIKNARRVHMLSLRRGR